MNTLRIKQTSHYPQVILDEKSGVFEISGRSLPEQVTKLYSPILDWLEEYTSTSHKQTTLNISLDYVNSSSTKYLLQILKTLNEYFNKGNKVLINWYFDEYDEDFEEFGNTYAELLDLDFKVIQKK